MLHFTILPGCGDADHGLGPIRVVLVADSLNIGLLCPLKGGEEVGCLMDGDGVIPLCHYYACQMGAVHKIAVNDS